MSQLEKDLTLGNSLTITWQVEEAILNATLLSARRTVLPASVKQVAAADAQGKEELKQFKHMDWSL